MEDQREGQGKHFASYERYRGWVATKHYSLKLLLKALVSLVGILVIIMGLILVPLPGPGWLIVFFGLSILGLEFPPIQRFVAWVGSKVRPLWRSLKARFSKRSSTTGAIPLPRI